MTRHDESHVIADLQPQQKETERIYIKPTFHNPWLRFWLTLKTSCHLPAVTVVNPDHHSTLKAVSINISLKGSTTVTNQLIVTSITCQNNDACPSQYPTS